MTADPPRLRMFAGPNGSGKSSLKTVLPSRLHGVYTNPDEIEASIRETGSLDFASFEVNPDPPHLLKFLRTSTLLANVGLADDINKLRLDGSRLYFDELAVNSYHASVFADYIRQELMRTRHTFTLETVMSSRSKLEMLARAKSLGYRIYLYYIATESPEVNISRVRNRVLDGGHDVPRDKIVSRYYRSLDLLHEAIALTDRAFIFDNSGHLQSNVWVAEITDGTTVEMRSEFIPAWFNHYVLKG